MVLDEWSGKEVLVTDGDRSRVRRTIEDALRKLEDVVSAMVESSLLGERKLPVTIDDVCLGDVVDAVQKLTCSEVRIVRQFSPELMVRCDSKLLVSAISEVVDNAVKYGAEPITIAAGADSDHHLSWIRIHDSGRGISDSTQIHGFEPFFRDDPEMQSNGGGIGLGLYRARRLVEAMGGSIAFADSDAGCAVLIELPEPATTTSAAASHGEGVQSALNR
jgi:K+-sensing histidine kinase KdpD